MVSPAMVEESLNAGSYNYDHGIMIKAFVELLEPYYFAIIL